MKHVLIALLRWIVVLLMPVVIGLLVARVMINAWYPRFEYARPDFPPDRYGFTAEERLELALVNIDYLNRPDPPDVAIAMLQELRIPGTNRLLFTTDEIRHMIDVKQLTDALWRVLAAAAALLALSLLALLARRETRAEGYAALFGGGLLTTGLLTLLIIFVFLSWNTLFVMFHNAFFQPGTWTFDWSDSLIRLFPERFWSDAGVLLVGSALVVGVIVMLVGFGLGRRARAARRAG